MKGWILSQLATGSPYGVAFEEDPPAGDPPPADPPAADPPADPPAWSFADGIAGEGDAPEWFKSGKYATVSAQAEAYTALEGKFGSFTGAPDEYEVKVSEELTEKGVTMDAEDPLVQEAMKFAKEAGMNQGGFEGMLNLYSMAKLAEQGAMDEHKAEEIKALGQNAQGRIDNINKWGDANMTPEQVQGLKEMTPTAQAVKTLEYLISKTSAASIDPNGNASPGAITETELSEMRFAKDEHGNRKINTDPAFKAEYEKKMKQFYGEGEHIQVIG